MSLYVYMLTTYLWAKIFIGPQTHTYATQGLSPETRGQVVKAWGKKRDGFPIIEAFVSGK